MNSYKNHINVLRHILKNFDDNEFDHIIKNILIKIFDIYYLERDIQLYNIDNVFKKLILTCIIYYLENTH